MEVLAAERPIRRHARLALIVILAGAAVLRLYGIAWDDGLLFHPDERHLLVVANGISFPWPPDWATLLSPESPWNPGSFAYGSLPIYLLRIVADLAGRLDPSYATLESSYLVGRVLSALFDLGTVALVFRLGHRLFDERVGLLAAALTAVTVLHVQLAHFFAVDTLLTFFVLLTVYLAVDLVARPSLRRGVAVGIAWGAAMATKVSAAPLGLAVVVAWLLGALASPCLAVARGRGGQRQGSDATALRSGPRRWTRPLIGVIVTGLAALFTFLVLEPYAAIDPVTFVSDVIHESQMARGARDIPYTRQFIGTLPYIYPIQQAIVWSMGIPLGIAGFVSMAVAIASGGAALASRRWGRAANLLVPVAWVVPYLAIVGSFHAKFLRYLLPILPFLSLWAAWVLVRLVQRGRRRLTRVVGWAALAAVLVGSTLYAVAYLNVYAETHPWIQTTAWLCQNLPRGSHIAVEHWDDPLPLRQATGDLRCFQQHVVTQVPMYDPDNQAKLATLLDMLEQNDYIVLASNRLYNTIPRLPARYPLTSRYYHLLMGEELGFELVYTAATYPRLFGVYLVHDTFHDPDLPKPALLRAIEAERRALVLGRADESYSVYDHPMTLVFRKVEALSREELLARFGDVARDLAPDPDG